ncbi:NADH dehydrogenase [ubiquinone] 1 beta subcomplex subunit 10-like [Mytilus trossulus]|uniref:NADH dehydrogenase [ubiquinone] 1 beta subcomplex subunit 10-like n=1 Tax=Mytilus trossulus TaxID=6551 RepID=UPI003003B163
MEYKYLISRAELINVKIFECLSRLICSAVKKFFIITETFVQPFQKKYPYYHRRFNRVPTIDQCDVNETACIYEAQEQWKRDKMVDSKIVRILKDRYIDCNYYEGEDAPVKCASIAAVSEEAATNWFIKCTYSLSLN